MNCKIKLTNRKLTGFKCSFIKNYSSSNISFEFYRQWKLIQNYFVKHSWRMGLHTWLLFPTSATRVVPELFRTSYSKPFLPPPVELDKCSDEARIHSEVWIIITALAVRGSHIEPQTMILYVTDYRPPFYAAWEFNTFFRRAFNG